MKVKTWPPPVKLKKKIAKIQIVNTHLNLFYNIDPLSRNFGNDILHPPFVFSTRLFFSFPATVTFVTEYEFQHRRQSSQGQKQACQKWRKSLKENWMKFESGFLSVRLFNKKVLKVRHISYQYIIAVMSI